MSGPSLVVFTDLDGTLLDHETYDFRPALPTLARLERLGIPLVLVTSKTRPEVIALREVLGHRGPFVVENGGAIYVPAGLFPQVAGDAEGGLQEILLGAAHDHVRAVLERLRAEHGLDFEGFSDVSAAQVAAWTGLSLEAAERARARSSSEPIRLHGDASALDTLRAALARHGLSLVRGGRFWSVQGTTDKGKAVRRLLDLFVRTRGASVTSVAVGDSENDLPMLAAVDVAIVLPRPSRPRVELTRDGVIRPSELGPRGFAEGVGRVLDRYDG